MLKWCVPRSYTIYDEITREEGCLPNKFSFAKGNLLLLTHCTQSADALDIAIVQVLLQGIATTEGAHASPDPLLTQKHIWQSITGESFVPTDILENSLGLVVFG